MAKTFCSFFLALTWVCSCANAESDIYVDQVLAVHNQATLALAKSDNEQLSAFCAMVENSVDVNGMANYALGATAGDLNAVELATYQSTFKNLVVDYFRLAWGRFLSNKSVEVRPLSRRRGDEYVVEVVVGRTEDNSGTVIQFLMKNDNHVIRLTNAIVPGLNLLGHIKSQFDHLSNQIKLSGISPMSAITDYLAKYPKCAP